jgi:outer membrane receptor for ferrienterochelin and colicins
MRINSLLCALIMLMCGLPSTTVVAEVDPNTEALFDMSLEDLMDVEIYSASKFSQKVSEAPSSVTVITADEIKLYGYRNITDILRSVPGFYDTYDRNYSYLGVRGFGRPGDYNSRILILIDGHRLNDSVGDTVLAGNEFPLDIDLIDRVEVVRGPGSALYGSNALFAVISVYTKKGGDYNGGEISTRYGSAEHTQGRLTYGRKLDNGLDFLASGTYANWEGEKLYYWEYDRPRYGYGRVDNDDENLKNFFIEASYGDFSFHAASTQRAKGAPTGVWETVFGNTGTRTQDNYTLTGLTWEHQVDDSLSVLGRFSYHHYNYDGRWIYDDGGLYENHDFWKGRWVVGEFQVTKLFDNGHKVVMGAETQYNIRQDQKNWDSDVYLDDQRHSKSWGVYVQDEFKLTDNLTLNAGVRRDYYDATGSSVNPRAALVYQLTEQSTLKFMAGKAFRAPSVYELYYHDGYYTTKPAMTLEPETIKTYEVVYENRFSKHWKGTVSGFYYQMEDLIDQVEDPGDGLMQYQNISEVTANGFEAGVEGNWENGLRGRLSYACVQTLDKSTRSELANSPGHLINFSVIYPLVKDRLFAGIDNKYTSKRRTLDNDKTNDAIVTNLTLTYANALKNLDMQLGLYNLFDIRYYHPGFIEHQQDMFEQDGRTFGGKMTYRF